MDKIEYYKKIDSDSTGWINSFTKEAFDYIKDNAIAFNIQLIHNNFFQFQYLLQIY